MDEHERAALLASIARWTQAERTAVLNRPAAIRLKALITDVYQWPGKLRLGALAVLPGRTRTSRGRRHRAWGVVDVATGTVWPHLQAFLDTLDTQADQADQADHSDVSVLIARYAEEGTEP